MSSNTVDYQMVSSQIQQLLQANIDAWSDEAAPWKVSRHAGYNAALHDLWERLHQIEYEQQRGGHSGRIAVADESGQGS